MALEGWDSPDPYRVHGQVRINKSFRSHSTFFAFMIQSSSSQFPESVQLKELARDAGVALIIQFGGLILTYLLQVFLARWMGKTEYGIYEYVISWSIVLAIPASLGFPRAVLRLVAEYKVKKDWGRLQGVIRGSWLLTVLASFLLCLTAIGVILLVDHYHNFVYARPLLLGMALVPLQALVQLQLETSRAMEDITLAFAPSLLIWPVLVLGGAFILVEEHYTLNSLAMISVATVVLLVVVMLQLGLLWNKLKKDFEPAPPVYCYREWLDIALVLLLQRAFMIILSQTDILMIGSFIGPEAAGIYNAAVKTSLWVGFVLQILNMVVAPAFASLYTQGDIQGLQKIVSTVTLWIFWPSIGIALFLLIFTQPVLSIFGPDFIAASWSLKILVLGQLVNALCGSIGCLIVMTGHQKQSFPIFGYSALINLVLNAITIPLLGIVGAAITTSFSMVVWNIWLSRLVVKKIGVNPSIFYSLLPRNNESAIE